MTRSLGYCDYIKAIEFRVTMRHCMKNVPSGDLVVTGTLSVKSGELKLHTV